jgi:N6-L-threonylcarbamoyladenine synthase
MGLYFPCGREMDELCSRGEYPTAKTKISVKGVECNLSGLENLSASLYEKTEDRGLVSAYCFDFIADTLQKLTDNLREKYSDIPVIYAGGVMSNSRIKTRLSHIGNVWFSEPQFSSDNAAGVALLARRAYIKNKIEE